MLGRVHACLPAQPLRALLLMLQRRTLCPGGAVLDPRGVRSLVLCQGGAVLPEGWHQHGATDCPLTLLPELVLLGLVLPFITARAHLFSRKASLLGGIFYFSSSNRELCDNSGHRRSGASLSVNCTKTTQKPSLFRVLRHHSQFLLLPY